VAMAHPRAWRSRSVDTRQPADRDLSFGQMRPRLVPELDVTDLDRSLAFYTDVCGFAVRYRRAEDRFAYLEREGAELMLEEAHGPARRFRTAPLDAPFGRGVNFQIEVSDVRRLYDAVIAAGVDPVLEIEQRTYRVEQAEVLTVQFVIADEDGYLLRFFSDSPGR
jgi:catechol 2,3-dioxygenase-like lactoylglutathione lyase family enzyme